MTHWYVHVSDSSHISFSNQHESYLSRKFENTFHHPKICSKTHLNPLKLGAHPHMNYTHLKTLSKHTINGAKPWNLMLTKRKPWIIRIIRMTPAELYSGHSCRHCCHCHMQGLKTAFGLNYLQLSCILGGMMATVAVVTVAIIDDWVL